jgi:hypothetical protein
MLMHNDRGDLRLVELLALQALNRRKTSGRSEARPKSSRGITLRDPSQWTY